MVEGRGERGREVVAVVVVVIVVVKLVVGGRRKQGRESGSGGGERGEAEPLMGETKGRFIIVPLEVILKKRPSLPGSLYKKMISGKS